MDKENKGLGLSSKTCRPAELQTQFLKSLGLLTPLGTRNMLVVQMLLAETE